MNSQHQDVVNQLQILTHYYNNPPHLLHEHKPTNNRNKFLNNSTTSSSSSNSTSFSIPLKTIPTSLYDDYTLNNKHISSKNPITTNMLHLQTPATSPTTTPPSPSSYPTHIWGNNITTKTHNDQSPITKTTFNYQSASSRDDDSFLCSKVERYSNLPVGDLITTLKENNHTRILFQNINSLEISSSNHTLELIRE